MKASKRLLITDLDNTAYDWVNYFVPSFYAMVDTAIKILGCSEDELLDDLRKVHVEHRDSEHPFALLETNVVAKKLEGKSLSGKMEILDPAFYAFNSERKARLRLYDDVTNTLEKIRKRNIKVVAYSESKFFGVVDRVKRLKLHTQIDMIYCRERAQTNHPRNLSTDDWLGDFPVTKIIEQCVHSKKPDPNVLIEICAKEKITPDEAVYVGDSLAKDILMANEAGITSVWAKYGTLLNKEIYNKLIRISHWTSEDVEREKKYRDQALNVSPDFIAKKSFKEVFNAFI